MLSHRLLLMLVAATAVGSVANPHPSRQTPVSEEDARGLVEWFDGPWFSAQRKARAEGKGVMLAFRADGFDWCDKLALDTFGDATAAGETAPLVCLLVDLTRDGDGHYRDTRAATLADEFPVRVFPTMFFISETGVLEDMIVGYIPPQPFVTELRRIREGTDTRSDYERRVAKDKNDIAARLKLARKLADLGDVLGQEREMKIIHQLDPRGESLPMREFAMDAVIAEMESRFDDDKGLYVTEPLQEFLKDEKHDQVLFQGWSYLANLRARLGQTEGACRAARAAWEHVPAISLTTFGDNLTQLHWNSRDQIDAKARAFALRVAEQVVSESEEAGADAVTRAHFLDSLACCYSMNGKRKMAIETIERCLKLAPDSEPYKLRLELFRLRD